MKLRLTANLIVNGKIIHAGEYEGDNIPDAVLEELEAGSRYVEDITPAEVGETGETGEKTKGKAGSDEWDVSKVEK